MAMQVPQREFITEDAKRTKVPLMVGLVGPSGGGKTFSALRLATGMQRVTGGDIHMIDTEARRGLHYADRFRFKHTPFGAPFSPLDYLAAIEHCVKRGAGVIIIDSMSHEHEGPGGVLEMHADETKRLAALWRVSESKAQMSAWAAPKQQRRRMINTILQLPVSVIFCFRAKEKLKIESGKDPRALGYMAIAGEELVFEMAMNCLLLPRADGVPTWQSDEIGERATMKLPAQFQSLFAERTALSEDIGEALAKWAEGAPAELSAKAKALVLAANEATTIADVEAVVAKAKAAGLRASDDVAAVRAAIAAAREAAQQAASSREPGDDEGIEANHG